MLNFVIYGTGVLSEAHFSVEQVIRCIRVSENPQTHHHALSLLAIGAQLFPVSYFRIVCLLWDVWSG